MIVTGGFGALGWGRYGSTSATSEARGVLWCYSAWRPALHGQDVAAFCLYDIKVVTWKQVREKLAELGVMASTS